MELKIIQQESLQPIEFNFEEIKNYLSTQLEHYNSITYTEDKVKDAKSDRATLNKFKGAIEARRMEIKKAHMKPYEDFEKKIKEIVALIDQPILAIDTQVKSFEEKTKAEKRKEIEAIYSESIGDLSELLPLKKIWDEKWLNASVTIKNVKAEILETIAKTKNDLEVISGLKSEFVLQVKDMYLRTLNLSAAMQEMSRLEEQKARQEAYDKRRAEEKEAEAQSIPEPVIAQPEPAKEPVKQEPRGLNVIDFRVWVTDEQLQLLKSFLVENSIKYGKVV